MVTRSRLAPAMIMIGAGGIFAWAAPMVLSQYGLHVAIISLFYILMSSAWNLVAGFTGQVSFAQAGFAAIGAYASGLLSLHTSLPIGACILIGAFISALTGCLLGKLCLPLGGKYLSLVTLSFSEIIRLILTNEDQWTRGTQGLQIAGMFNEYSKAHVLWLLMGVTLFVLVSIRALIGSRLGLLFKAVMSDEIAAASVGVPTTRIRVLAFTLSSLISGVAGAIYGHYLELITPDLGSLDQMFLILAMVWVGGKGTWMGPVLGAIGLEILTEQLRDFGSASMLVFGIITLVVIRFAPAGILGSFRKLRWERIT